MANPNAALSANCPGSSQSDPESHTQQQSPAWTAGEWQWSLSPHTLSMTSPSREAIPSSGWSTHLAWGAGRGPAQHWPHAQAEEPCSPACSGLCPPAASCPCSGPGLAREAKAQLKTPFKPFNHPLHAHTGNYTGSLGHPRHWGCPCSFPRGGEWGKHPGRMALLCSLGQAAPSLPGAIRTFPHTTSSSSPKRLCRVSLFPSALHTRGATSFGSAWKSWRQAWRSRRAGARGDGCQYPSPLKEL